MSGFGQGESRKEERLTLIVVMGTLISLQVKLDLEFQSLMVLHVVAAFVAILVFVVFPAVTLVVILMLVVFIAVTLIVEVLFTIAVVILGIAIMFMLRSHGCS